VTSDRYRVRTTARAERDLGNLPDKVAAACVEFIFGPLAANPHRLGSKLRGELAGLHSAWRSTYRVVYEIREDESS
jgi:mRNA interferase RelE/StbE